MSLFNRLDQYRELLSHLKQADAAEVYASRTTGFKIGLRDGEIESYDVSSSAGLCLRAVTDSVGYAYTEHPDDDPQRLLSLAVANATSVESKDEQPLFAGGTYGEPVGIDPKLIAATAESKIALAHELEHLALRDKRIKKLKHCVVATAYGDVALFNSLGLDATDSAGYAVAYCSPVAEQNGEVKDSFAYRAARSIEELDLAGLADEAVSDALFQFGATSVSSGRYPVVLKNTAVCDLLAAFSSMFSAEAAQKGLSLLAGKEGQSVAARCVRLLDTPNHPLSMNNARFDAEGVPSSSTTLIDEGVFQTLLYNLKTAKKAGKATTGNAGKASVASPVDVSPSNLYIAPGYEPLSALFGKMGYGLYLTNLSGLHAGTNAVSGQFSLLCRGAWIEGGQIARPVEQITVSGDFLSLLQSVAAAGDDLRFDLPGSRGCMGAPSLLVESLQVSGR